MKQMKNKVYFLLFQDLTDVSNGCGTSYSTVIVSEKFVGKSLLERHRMVNGALAEEMKQIHAFSMKTLTPEQWEKQKLG